MKTILKFVLMQTFIVLLEVIVSSEASIFIPLIKPSRDRDQTSSSENFVVSSANFDIVSVASGFDSSIPGPDSDMFGRVRRSPSGGDDLGSGSSGSGSDWTWGDSGNRGSSSDGPKNPEWTNKPTGSWISPEKSSGSSGSSSASGTATATGTASGLKRPIEAAQNGNDDSITGSKTGSKSGSGDGAKSDPGSGSGSGSSESSDYYNDYLSTEGPNRHTTDENGSGPAADGFLLASSSKSDILSSSRHLLFDLTAYFLFVIGLRVLII